MASTSTSAYTTITCGFRPKSVIIYHKYNSSGSNANIGCYEWNVDAGTILASGSVQTGSTLWQTDISSEIGTNFIVTDTGIQYKARNQYCQYPTKFVLT